MICIHCNNFVPSSWDRDEIVHYYEMEVDRLKKEIVNLESIIEDSTKLAAKLQEEKQFSTFKRILPGGTW